MISPAFSADCIETLEEIQGEICEAFEHAGGESFTYIPRLNDDDAHIAALMAVIGDNLAGWFLTKKGWWQATALFPERFPDQFEAAAATSSRE